MVLLVLRAIGATGGTILGRASRDQRRLGCQCAGRENGLLPPAERTAGRAKNPRKRRAPSDQRKGWKINRNLNNPPKNSPRLFVHEDSQTSPTCPHRTRPVPLPSYRTRLSAELRWDGIPFPAEPKHISCWPQEVPSTPQLCLLRQTQGGGADGL